MSDDMKPDIRHEIAKSNPGDCDCACAQEIPVVPPETMDAFDAEAAELLAEPGD